MAETPTLIHMITSNRWGGIERYALDICRYYNDKGWNVIALTRGALAVDNMFHKEGIPVKHAPFGGLWDYQSVRQISQLIKSLPDKIIIHSHGFRDVFTALAARRLSGRNDVRVVITRHKVRNAVDSWLLRLIYRNIDAMIFVSRTARDRFLATWQNRDLPFSSSRIHIIHNSLYLKKNSISDSKKQHPLTAMYHGTLKPGKGLETIIDALALLKGKRIRFKIVGSGAPDYVDKLRRRAISRGVIEMIDWHKHTDTPYPLIADCDFGVLPSVKEEAFGLSNLEYMAAGRAQICTSNGAQPEYITDGWEGLLIPPGNPIFLAQTISRLALNPELRQQMGSRAHETFSRRLSWDNFISHLQSVYLERSRVEETNEHQAN